MPRRRNNVWWALPTRARAITLPGVTSRYSGGPGIAGWASPTTPRATASPGCHAFTGVAGVGMNHPPHAYALRVKACHPLDPQRFPRAPPRKPKRARTGGITIQAREGNLPLALTDEGASEPEECYEDSKQTGLLCWAQPRLQNRVE